jgi:hypothetical protein
MSRHGSTAAAFAVWQVLLERPLAPFHEQRHPPQTADGKATSCRRQWQTQSLRFVVLRTMTKGQKKSERAPISALVASRRNATIMLLMLESRMLMSNASGVSASGPPGRTIRPLLGCRVFIMRITSACRWLVILCTVDFVSQECVRAYAAAYLSADPEALL